MYVNAVPNQYGFFGQDGRKFLQRMSWGGTLLPQAVGRDRSSGLFAEKAS